MINKIKNIGGMIGSLGGWIFMIVVLTLVIVAMLWVGEKTLPWLLKAGWIIFYLNLLIFLPLALIKKTVVLGASSMIYSSYLFGITLWFTSLLLTYEVWGMFGVVIGLLLAGVGIVPVAFLAMLINGESGLLLILFALLVLTYGLKVLAVFLATRMDRLEFESRAKESDVIDVYAEDKD